MTSHWTGGDGDWSDASAWTPAAVPATADAVLLDGTAAYTLTVSDAEAASSLALSDDSATLSVTGTLAVAGAASLASGVTLLSGTLSAGSLTGTIRASGGTLSGGTVTGTLALVSPAGPFAAFPAPGTLSVGGLAMSAGAVLSVRDVELGLLADQSLAAGTLALGTAMDGGQAVALAGHILTVGRGATVLLPDGGSLDGGTLVNAGTINAQHISPFAGGTLSVGGSAFAQDGTLLATNQAVLVTAASFDNTGTLSVSNGALLLQAARASNEGVISLGFGASLLAEAALSGAGTLQVGANARAELQDLSGTVALAPGGDGSLRLDHAETFSGTITGLGPGLGTGGGTLELAGLSSPVLSVSWSGGRMLVTEASGAFSLAMPDLSPAATFALAADAAGDGYDVTVSANCFGRGTAIRARRGALVLDVPVEELQPGEEVWSPRLRSLAPGALGRASPPGLPPPPRAGPGAARAPARRLPGRGAATPRPRALARALPVRAAGGRAASARGAGARAPAAGTARSRGRGRVLPRGGARPRRAAGRGRPRRDLPR